MNPQPLAGRSRLKWRCWCAQPRTYHWHRELGCENTKNSAAKPRTYLWHSPEPTIIDPEPTITAQNLPLAQPRNCHHRPRTYYHSLEPTIGLPHCPSTRSLEPHRTTQLTAQLWYAQPRTCHWLPAACRQFSCKNNEMIVKNDNVYRNRQRSHFFSRRKRRA